MRYYLNYKTVFLCFIFLLAICFTSCGVFNKTADNVLHDVYNDNSSPNETKTIIIDPGHGGMDGGAVGINGCLEKDINLNISRYIMYFCRLSGINCVLTRSEDVMLIPKYNGSVNKKRADLVARTEIADSFENSVFVSIHQNNFSIGKYNGLQVFYSPNNESGEYLAEIISNRNRSMIDGNNTREIKKAGTEIYILDNIRKPAVLVECGFLSNADEAKKLSTEEYQKKIAFMIYVSLMDFIYTN